MNIERGQDSQGIGSKAIASVRRLCEVNPGFQPEHLIALDVSTGGPGYTNEFHGIQFVEQLLARLSDLPGVESAAAVDGLPLVQAGEPMKDPLSGFPIPW